MDWGWAEGGVKMERGLMGIEVDEGLEAGFEVA